MKKILIYAYTNFNLGDDLFIKILCERYPKTNFILYAPKNYKDNFSYLKNVKIVPSDLFLVKLINFILLKILRLNISMRELLAIRCDGIVNIGGSLFMQSDNWKEKIKRRKKISNKPFFY